MDTVRNADGQTNDVVLRCLTPSGEISWELKIDQTKYATELRDVPLAVRFPHAARSARSGHAGGLFVGNPKLFFVDLNHRHPD